MRSRHARLDTAEIMGFWERLVLASRCWYAILVKAALPEDASARLGRIGQPATLPTGAAVAKESQDRATQLLALLQRDGRLVDFLEEDISPYPDGQLGAAVRSIHQGCRQALEKYLELEPIMTEPEDSSVTVSAATDPAAIKLVGNLRTGPPIKGIVRHRGWRVRQTNLPPLPEGEGRVVVAPAEVEVP